MAKKKTVKKQLDQSEIIKRIIILIVVIVLIVLGLFKLGVVGIVLNNLMRYLLGEFFYVPLLSILFLVFYYAYLYKKIKIGPKIISGLIILNLAFILISALLNTHDEVGMAVIKGYFSFDAKLFENNQLNYAGGILGALLYALTSSLFDQTGTMIVIGALILVGLLLVVPFNYFMDMFDKSEELKDNIAAKWQEKKQSEKVKSEKLEFIQADDIEDKPPLKKSSLFIEADREDKELASKASKMIEENRRPLYKDDSLPNYKLPPLSLFEANTSSKSSSINRSSADVKGKKVIEILSNFGIEAQLLNTHIGPSVTKFEIKPESGVKVSKIQNIADNIKMELAAKDIRIEAPIPGRSAVGIEIPNVEMIPVRMSDLVSNIPASKKNSLLLFPLGKDLLGKVVTCEIDKMPHLLIAGATGSGKSVCINAIITSLLFRTKPNEVKMVLVDPKKVEFTPYHDVPHLLWPVITDATMASNMLKKVVVMMEGRYDAFAEAGVRNIAGYNEMVDDYNEKNTENKMVRMPYIVVIIDELADLMMVAGKEVEASIQRITQLARASGIHLIVATQRPSTDVITGIIKSNIPSRISFSVSSSIDSRTILDQTGAERLLGNGDMLYFPQGETSPIRLQGVFVTDSEIKKVTDFTKKQAKPDYDDTYFEFQNINNQYSGGPVRESDSLYEEVKEYVIDVNKASTSLLQRRFGIGYNRAAGLIDALEKNGVIGPANGSKPREVFIKKEEEE